MLFLPCRGTKSNDLEFTYLTKTCFAVKPRHYWIWWHFSFVEVMCTVFCHLCEGEENGQIGNAWIRLSIVALPQIFTDFSPVFLDFLLYIIDLFIYWFIYSFIVKFYTKYMTDRHTVRAIKIVKESARPKHTGYNDIYQITWIPCRLWLLI